MTFILKLNFYSHSLKLYLTATVDTITTKLRECSSYGVNLQLEMEEYLFDSGLTSYSEESKQPGIIKLEHSLLKISGVQDLTQGIFYMLPIYTNNHLYIRYKCLKYYFPTTVNILNNKTIQQT